MPIGSAQTHLTIIGSVYDKDSGDNLSFASINLKNKFKGTVANSAGGFSFTIPKKHLKDTL